MFIYKVYFENMLWNKNGCDWHINEFLNVIILYVSESGLRIVEVTLF